MTPPREQRRPLHHAPSGEEVAATLRAHGYRVTPQRLVVQETLAGLGRHVSAEELLEAVGKRLPTVSLPTIYASLDALERAGLVRRVAAGRGRALYDARPAEHHHLVCMRCGAVEDLDVTLDLEAAVRGAQRRGFDADGAEVVVHGVCARCASH